MPPPRRRKRSNDGGMHALVSRIKSHVDKKKGVSNKMLHSFASSAIRNCDEANSDLHRREGNTLPYVGTFSADQIPSLRRRRRQRFCMIVNLQRSDDVLGETGHFVTLVGFPDYTLYIDSFGMGCTQKDVVKFVQARNVPLFRNRRAIQHDRSVFCGMFCILFCLYHHLDPPWRLHFTPVRGIHSNEVACMNYVNKLLSAHYSPRHLARFLLPIIIIIGHEMVSLFFSSSSSHLVRRLFSFLSTGRICIIYLTFFPHPLSLLFEVSPPPPRRGVERVLHRPENSLPTFFPFRRRRLRRRELQTWGGGYLPDGVKRITR